MLQSPDYVASFAVYITLGGTLTTGQINRLWAKKGHGPKPPDFADGMFMGELEMQSEFACRAFGQMRELHADQPTHPSLLALAHAMLVFAGNAAKILSPSPKANSEVRARANRFRREIKVPDSDLKQINDARNYLEHFDERMDRFLAIPGGIVIHRFVRDHEPSELGLDDGRKLQPRFLQLLQTTDWYLLLHGDRVDLQKIYATMEHLGTQARMHFQKQGVPGYGSAPNPSLKRTSDGAA